MIKKLKRRVYLWLSGKGGNSSVLHGMQLINQVLFHWNARMHMTHPGKEDPDKVYYIIRPSSKAEGLLSLYFNNGISGVQWGMEQGYIPYIDYDTENCQYHVERKVNGTNNAWEYYFKQPVSLTMDDLQRKKNVLLSGWKWKNESGLRLSPELVQTNPTRKICQNICSVQPYIYIYMQKILPKKKWHQKRHWGSFCEEQTTLLFDQRDIIGSQL